jgi:hypothetical protein
LARMRVRRRAAFSGSANGRSAVSFKIKVSHFPMLVNGTALPSRSCQFGTMCTEPGVPHSLQTRRREIIDQGRCWGPGPQDPRDPGASEPS